MFGNPEREDVFHEATANVLGALSRSLSDPKDALPFALDTAARRSEIISSGAFDEPSDEMYRWVLWLSTQQAGALYATF